MNANVVPSPGKRIRAVADADNFDFLTLVRLSGLDPANDFRYMDLRGFDFSNCDLSGFDLRGSPIHGANLAGAKLSKTKLDKEQRLLVRLQPLINQAAGGPLFGYYAKSIEANDKLVSIYRKLARIRPYYFLQDLALSLRNRADALSNLDRAREGLACVEEAIAILRGLEDSRSDSVLSTLSSALGVWSDILMTLGRVQAALDALDEEVSIRRRLAQTTLGDTSSGLAASLDKQAYALTRHGRPELALVTVGEAVSINRHLAKLEPKVYSSALAESLCTLADTLTLLRRHDARMEILQEAIIVCQLARDDEHSALTLATSMVMLSDALAYNGRYDEASIFFAKAVIEIRGVILQRPERPRTPLREVLRPYFKGREWSAEDAEAGVSRLISDVLDGIEV